MLEPVVDLGPFVVGDVVVGPFDVGFIDEAGDPADLTGFTVTARLLHPDGTIESAGITVDPSGAFVTVSLPGTPFDVGGLHRIEFTFTSGPNTVRGGAVEFVVDDVAQGWPTIEQVRKRWRDAPANDVHLWALLDVARQQVLAWGPKDVRVAIEAGLIPVPTNYIAARITQARNIWNAVKTDPNTGAIGDEGFLIRPFPLDWTVKQMIRPKRAKPTVESRGSTTTPYVDPRVIP